MNTTVRFRAYPTPAQQVLWAKHAGACRAMFNLALDHTLTVRQMGGEWPTESQHHAQLKDLRNDPDIAPWLADTPMQVLQQSIRTHHRAWRNCAHGARRPRFKRKGGRQTFTLPQRITVTRTSRRRGTVTMPGGGRTRLRVRWHRTPPGTVKSATYVREPDGTYWVSIVCETRDRQPTKHLNDHGPIGVDLGVEVAVATSNGEQWDPTGLKPKEAERLRRLQRQLQRRPRTRLPDGRKVDGANRRKTKQAIATLQARARRRRHDLAEQVSHRLTNNHSEIVFEELGIKDMAASARGTIEEPGVGVARKRGLNRSILGVGWGRIIARTRDKAQCRGATVVQVNPAYTSQTCPECGTVDPSQRVTRSRYECRVCGYEGHADVGAARNILRRALDASVDGVSAHGTWVAACRDLQTSVGSTTQEQENRHSTAPAAA